MEENQLNSLKINSRIIKIFDYLLMIFITCFIIKMIQKYNFAFPDYQNYYNIYSEIGLEGIQSVNGVETGFKILCLLFYNLGFSYLQFYMILMMISLILLYETVFYYTKIRSIVFIFYIIFPFCLDIVQIRNLLAGAIVVFSIKFLSNSFKKGGLFYYLILNALAISIHFTAAYYFLFLLAKFVNKKNLLKFVVMITVLVVFSLSKINELLNSSEFTTKYLAYTGNQIKLSGVVAVIFLISCSTFCLYFMTQENLGQPEHDDRDFEFLFKVNMLMLPLIVVFFINIDIFRLFRNLIILNNCVFVYNIFHAKRLTVSRLIIYGLYLACFVGFAYTFLYYSNGELVSLIYWMGA